MYETHLKIYPKRRFLLVSLILLTVLILNKKYKTQLFEEVASHLSFISLLISKQITTRFNNFMETRISHKELLERLKTLKFTQNKLLSELNELKASNTHYSDVKAVLEFQKRYNSSYMKLAQVIGRYSSATENVIFLDVGSKRGVTADMVVVFNNYLVGRVSAVYPYFCRVLLLNNRQSKIPISCADTKTRAIFEGTGNVNSGTLSFVSHLCKLKKGELVISSGEGFIYPKGFVIGYIENFSLDSHALQYDVEVSLAIDPKSLEFCYILQKGAEFNQIDTEP